MTAPIFASVFAYAFGKKHFPNITDAVNLELAKGEGSEVPGFRTLYRLRKLSEVAVAVECSTLISKARCLVSGKFLRSGLPLWVSIDDDVDADVAALGTLIDAAMSGQHRQGSRVVYGAMKTRVAWETRYNVGMVGADGRPVDGNAGGEVTIRTGQLFPVTHGGAALMAVPRAALDRMMKHFPELYFEEEASKGSKVIERNPALFLEALVDSDPAELVRKRVWLGEDVMFSRRAEAAGVSRYGFIHPGIVHAGIPSV